LRSEREIKSVRERKIEKQRWGKSREGETERKRERERERDMREGMWKRQWGLDGGGGGSRRSNIQRNVPGG